MPQRIRSSSVAVVLLWLAGNALRLSILAVPPVVAILRDAFPIPLILPLLAGSWRMSFVFWSVPIAIIALVIYLFAPRAHAQHVALPRKWLPDWHVGLVWWLGALFCCINAIYFNANAFIPIYLT